MEIVNFLYGLSFVTIGVAILAQPRHESRFVISHLLWLFAAYSLIHAPADFADGWMAAHRRYESMAVASMFATFISYGFLFEFGRRIWNVSGGKIRAWWLPALGSAAFLVSIVVGGSRLAALHASVGYFVRTPGGILAGAGLYRYYRAHRQELRPLGVRGYFAVASVALLVWSFFCGVIRARASFFPASVINVESFRRATGIPVEVFRAMCGLATAWAVGGMLRIFAWEIVLLERLDRSKDELLSTVSHELRTPLTSLGLALSSIGTVAREQLSEPAVQLLHMADSNVKRMGRLVNDILDLEAIRAGKLELHIEPVDPVRLVSDAVSEQAAIASRRGVEIVAETDAVRDARVSGDRDRLVRILENLLSNALKFSPRDSRVVVRASARDDSRVRFEVIDRGPGIPPERIPLLFKRYERLSPADGVSRPGNGLGLAISRALVEELKGRIGVKSRVGEGTTFYFDVPTETATNRAA